MDFLLYTFLLLTVFFFIRLKSEDIFDVPNLVVYLLFFPFVLRPILLLLNLDYPYPPYLFREGYKVQVREAMVLFVLWFWLFGVGYSSKWRIIRGLGKFFPLSRCGIVVNRLSLVLAACVVCNLGFIFLIYMRTGPFTIRTIGEVRVGDTLEGIKFLRQIPFLTAYLGVVGVIVWMRLSRNRDARRNFRLRVLWGLSLVTLSMGCGGAIMLGDRSGVVLPLAAGVMSYHFGVRRIGFARLVGWGVVLLLILQIGYVFRIALMKGILERGGLEGVLYQLKLSFRNLYRQSAVAFGAGSFDAMLLVLRDFGIDNFRKGKDFLLGVLGAVPRAIWRNKPRVIHPGEWLREYYLPGSVSGWPFTIVGQWYVNFLFPGVLLGALLSGLMLRVVRERYFGLLRNPVNAVSMFIVVVNVFPGGVITQTPMLYVLWVVPMYLVVSFVSKKS